MRSDPPERPSPPPPAEHQAEAGPRRGDVSPLRPRHAQVGITTARVLAGVVGTLGALALVGWAADISLLRSVGPGLVPMMPNTAVAFLLLSGALGLLAGADGPGWRQATGRLAALGGAAIGGLTLAEYAFAWDAGIDRLLFAVDIGEVWPSRPGRPALTTAWCLAAIGLGLLGLPLARRSRLAQAVVQLCCFMAAATAYIMVLGYVYDVSVLYAWLPNSPMALHTGVGLLVLSAGLLAATPGAALPRLLVSPGAGGRALRRLTAPTLLGPIALGWLRIEAGRAGLVPVEVGVEFMVLVITVVGFGFLWWSAAAFTRAEAELRDLYENAPCGYHSLDAEGRVVRINDTELAWLGYTREEVLGKPWAATFLGDAGREVFRANFPRFKERGWIKDLPFDLRCKDGSTFPVLVSATAVQDEAGAYLMSRSTVYDMTDRRRLEEAQQQSDERVRAVLEAAPDALLLIDTGGRVSYANAYAAELFGYPQAELIGLVIDQLMPVEAREEHRGEREGFRLSGALVMGPEREIRGARRDGGEFPAEVRLSPVLAPGGPFVAVSVRDLSERQRMLAETARRGIEAEQARELARVKDYLLSTISHEMKTPVSLMVGYAELLEDKYPSEEVVTGLLDGAHRLATHVNRIIDLAALLGGAMPLYRTEVDPVELLEATHRMVAPALAAGRVQWLAEVAPDLPCFEGDAHRLAQMLAELVDNARRFTPAGGSVGVRIAGEGSSIVITVRDSGPGIEPRQLAQVWEAFNQLRTTDALRPGGLGLGLALVKGLAELHGGRVTLTSPPGGGTLATVELPALPGAEAKLVPEGVDQDRSL